MFVLRLSKQVHQKKKKGSSSKGKKLKRKTPAEPSSLTSSEETISVSGSPRPIQSPPPKTTNLRRSPSPRTPSPQRPSSPIHQSSPLPSITTPEQPTIPQSVSTIPSSSFIRSPQPTYTQGRKKSILVNIRKTFKKFRFEYNRFQEIEQENVFTPDDDASDDDAN
uniref:proteoglycan 4-like n=1 Tax=Erigeron canadensis TaxID=72917 RepID=UPI001CB8D62B|nr:proteoglycan 4-like [Erigeron canadensis]